MEIAVLLLLTVTVTAAIPLRPTQRSDTDSSDAVEASAAKKSEVVHVQHVSLLRVIPIPFRSEDIKRENLDAMTSWLYARLRIRRAPVRGCQLGTCQVHNLANTLYQISKTSGKDESKKANDPQGYGR